MGIRWENYASATCHIYNRSASFPLSTSLIEEKYKCAHAEMRIVISISSLAIFFLFFKGREKQHCFRGQHKEKRLQRLIASINL